MQVSYRRGGEDMLELVEPLWKELNHHHRELASQYKEHYDRITFDMRRQMILKQAAPGLVSVEMVYQDGQKMIGYCISLVERGGRGEIASIFIVPEWRNRNLGKTLIVNSLEWMKSHGAGDILVTVLPENSNAQRFYSRFGFYSRLLLMLRPESVAAAD